MEDWLGWARQYELIASVGRKKCCGVQSRVEIRGSCLHNPPLERFSQERLNSAQLTPMASCISNEMFHLSCQLMLFYEYSVA